MPSIEGEIRGLYGQLRAAQQTGNAELIRQTVQAIFGKGNELLGAVRDIKDATKNTPENTEALKEFRGSLAWEYRGQTETDLMSITPGA